MELKHTCTPSTSALGKKYLFHLASNELRFYACWNKYSHVAVVFILYLKSDMIWVVRYELTAVWAPAKTCGIPRRAVVGERIPKTDVWNLFRYMGHHSCCFLECVSISLSGKPVPAFVSSFFFAMFSECFLCSYHSWSGFSSCIIYLFIL